jgi:oxygen-independent coproporphyrinogen-3 oxidase
VVRQLHLAGRGRLLLRSIAMCFDAYLHANEAPRRFSRTI